MQDWWWNERTIAPTVGCCIIGHICCATKSRTICDVEDAWSEENITSMMTELYPLIKGMRSHGICLLVVLLLQRRPLAMALLE